VPQAPAPAPIPAGTSTPTGPQSVPTATNPSIPSTAPNPPSREGESVSTTVAPPQGTQVASPNEPRLEQTTQTRVEIPTPAGQELPRTTSPGEPGGTGRAPSAPPNMAFMLSSMLRMRDDYRSISSQLFSVQGASPADTARLSALQESFDRLDRESGRMLDNLRSVAFSV
jgi:hypothetical protein